MESSSRIGVDDLLAHRAWLERLATELLQDPAEAEDVVQQAWIAALERPPRKREALRPWLAQTVRNLALQWKRGEGRRRHHQARVGKEPSHSTDELVAQADLQQHLAREVVELNEPYRGVVLQRYYDGLSAAEIARRQGSSAGTVRSQLQRALGKLRSRLESKYGGQEVWASALAALLAGRLRVPPFPGIGVQSATRAVHAKSILLVAMVAGAVALWVGRGVRENPARLIEVGSAEGTTDVKSGTVSLREVEASGVVPKKRVEVRPSPTSPEGGLSPGRTGNPAEARIVVTLLSPESLTPVEGAHLFLSEDENGWSTSIESPTHVGGLNDVLTTNNKGQVTFLTPPDRTYFLWIDWLDPVLVGQGIGTTYTSIVTSPKEGERAEVQVLASKFDASYVGRIVDQATRQPISGAQVELISPHTQSLDRSKVLAEATTNPSGFFELSWASTFATLFRVSAAGYGWMLIEPSRGHETSVSAEVIPISRSAHVDVLVRDAQGLAVEGVDVVLTTDLDNVTHQAGSYRFGGFGEPRWSGVADSHGRCQIRNVRPRASLIVDVRREGVLLQAWNRDLVLEPEQMLDLYIDLSAGCTIQGRLIEPNGTPFADTEVWLTEPAPEFMKGVYFVQREFYRFKAFARTDVDGRFRFDDIGSGRWLLGPAPFQTPGGDRKYDQSLPAPAITELELRADEKVREVELVTHRGLYISGRVRRSARPQDALTTVVRCEVCWAHGATGLQGRFFIGPLVPGTCSLTALREKEGISGWSSPVQATVGDSDVLIVLE